MQESFCLLLMFFFHIVDDFYLQGWLASAKQKKWWEQNAPQKLYQYDYIVALMIHSFSWSFMIMLPIAIMEHYRVNSLFLLLLIINLMIHAITDHAKANIFKINLIIDQSIHVLQIILTFLLYMIYG